MFFITFYGPPGGIRTHYPRLRRPVLYPDELRADELRNMMMFRLYWRRLSRPERSLETLYERIGQVYRETIVNRTKMQEYRQGTGEVKQKQHSS